jgi:hypothetical protein
MVATTLARSPLACRRAITARPARGSVRVQAATLALPDSISKVRKLLSNAGRHWRWDRGGGTVFRRSVG